jgi:hypothetical protein
MITLARRAATLVTLSCVLGCSAEESPGPNVTMSDSAGVLITTVVGIPDLADPEAQWRLTFVREIAGGGAGPGDPVTIYDPSDGARFDDGTLVVFDNGPYRLLVIDAVTDSVVARFAPRGRGPGEILGDGVALIPNDDRTLTAVELWGNRRIHRFTLAGTLVDDVPLGQGGGYPWGPGRTRQEIAIHIFKPSAAATGPAYVDSVARVDLLTGSVAAFAPLPERGLDPSPPLFYPIALWTTFRSGGVITGMTDSGEFRYYSPDGRLEREIRLPITPRPATQESVDEVMKEHGAFLASFGQGKEGARFHSHHRLALRLVTVDDSVFGLVHSWASSPAEDPELEIGEIAWRLFNLDGRPEGVVRFPVGFSPWHVMEGRVLGVFQDSSGVSTVREYSLRRPAERAQR